MRVEQRFVAGEIYPITEAKARRGWLVQKCYDRTLRRPVVLKSVPRESARETQELIHEAAMLRHVQSPYVVSCLGLVSSSPLASFLRRGRLYLILEHFSDDTLRKLVEDRHGDSLDEDRSLRITIHLLQAFEALNRAGIIHRDFHPGHVSYRDRDHLRLFDLGASLSNFAVPSPLVIANPHTTGTWETMAPEEFVVGAPVTPAANVYSAGCLLYRLLEGRYPLDYKDFAPDWRAVTPQGQQELQCNLHHYRPVQYPATLNPGLRACLKRALGKKPGDRYPSPRDFRADLAAVLHSRGRP